MLEIINLIIVVAVALIFVLVLMGAIINSDNGFLHEDIDDNDGTFGDDDFI